MNETKILISPNNNGGEEARRGDGRDLRDSTISEEYHGTVSSPDGNGKITIDKLNEVCELERERYITVLRSIVVVYSSDYGQLS